MKKILVVVDFQKDFVDGSLGFAGAAALDAVIFEKIRRYRDRGDDVAFTMDTHDEAYLTRREGKALPVTHCIKGSDGWQLYGEVAALATPDTPIFTKPTFGSMELAAYMAQQGYDEVELVGLVSNICVISNAVLAQVVLPEATIIVDAAATASFDPLLNEKALDVMEGLQIKVINRRARPAL